MNQKKNSLAQDNDVDSTMEEEVRSVRMDAILTWPTRESARASRDGRDAMASIDETWARRGLLAGKNARKTSTGMLERAAGLLRRLATTCKKDRDTVEA